MKYTLLILFLVFAFSYPAAAQYEGGSNDGTAFLQAKSIQNTTPGIYSGGNNDGHSVSGSTSQNAFPGIYFGGINDGHAMLQAKGLQNILPGIYTGGLNDGHATASIDAQNPTPGIYNGGINDGVAWTQSDSQHSSPSIYLGGANDGFDMSGGRAVENSLPPIYAGGTEDGYAFAVSLNQNSNTPPPHDALRTALLQLSGSWFNDDAVLGWATTMDPALDHFELQRSVDGGKSFEAIAEIEPNADEVGPSDYRYNDVRAYYLPADYLLYRLKCVDKEGGFRHSAIVRLAKDKTAPVMVAYPNPSSGRFTLAMLNVTDVSGYRYILSSAEGKLITRGTIQSTQTSFDLSGHASATYHLFLYKDGKLIQHFTILLTP